MLDVICSVLNRCLSVEIIWTLNDTTIVFAFLFNVRQSYCARYSYRLDVSLSVRPSVHHTLILCRNGSTYGQTVCLVARRDSPEVAKMCLRLIAEMTCSVDDSHPPFLF